MCVCVCMPSLRALGFWCCLLDQVKNGQSSIKKYGQVIPITSKLACNSTLFERRYAYIYHTIWKWLQWKTIHCSNDKWLNMGFLELVFAEWHTVTWHSEKFCVIVDETTQTTFGDVTFLQLNKDWSSPKAMFNKTKPKMFYDFRESAN